MKSQIAEKQNKMIGQTRGPCLRALEEPTDISISLLTRIWKQASKILCQLGRALCANDDIETWRRLEFKNEYQDDRTPNRIDLHRWF